MPVTQEFSQRQCQSCGSPLVGKSCSACGAVYMDTTKYSLEDILAKFPNLKRSQEAGTLNITVDGPNLRIVGMNPEAYTIVPIAELDELFAKDAHWTSILGTALLSSRGNVDFRAAISGSYDRLKTERIEILDAYLNNPMNILRHPRTYFREREKRNRLQGSK
jgi:hypothetical protein